MFRMWCKLWKDNHFSELSELIGDIIDIKHRIAQIVKEEKIAYLTFDDQHMISFFLLKRFVFEVVKLINNFFNG